MAVADPADSELHERAGTDQGEATGATGGESGRSSRPGTSALALPAVKPWDAGDRPQAWRGRVYGLVVHTTGSTIPANARGRGVYHTVEAVDRYTLSHGCHYINGWRGAEGGDLLQMANEDEQANGVGVTNRKEPAIDQRRSIDSGRFEADLPAVLVRLWRERWPGVDHSLDLLPGTKTANACYVHVECVPCVFHAERRLLTDAEPLGPGLRFTRAQHDTVALLAVDIARRNGWPTDESWWRTPRLLGHEDLTPVSRHDSKGGWDPGYLREKPYFDWDYVYDQIAKIVSGDPDAPALPIAAAEAGSVLAGLGDLIDRFRELVAKGQDASAVAAARENGIRDVNELTNLVFFSRHPEMQGRKIGTEESDLAGEWRHIRDTIVRPSEEARPASSN
jgi:hypothetical protein